MTNGTDNDMIKEKMRQLIQDSISSQQDDSANVYAVDYNWSEPRVFNEKQKETLNQFIVKLTEAVAVNLNSFFKAQTDVQLNQTSTHFAQQLTDQINQAQGSRSSIAFSDGKNTCGLITMTKDNALELLKPILGQMDDSELSLLEISLLEDIFAIVLDSLRQSHQALNFKLIDSMSIGTVDPDFEPTLEVIKIELGITDSITDMNSKIDIVIDCSKLFPVVGKTITRTDFAKQQIEEALIECFDKTTVDLTCQFASQNLTVKQIMSLQPEDIVVLDKSIYEPFVVKMDDKPIFNAKPCSSNGFYAALLTEPIIASDSRITDK
ncbi:MAG: FliM/FliN family flagellar motor switch protein [Anaerohalosphaera sp.]|nr:FliM/FliN family flagellar motor switch protein [Anaerohalosphaera sp.]